MEDGEEGYHGLADERAGCYQADRESEFAHSGEIRFLRIQRLKSSPALERFSPLDALAARTAFIPEKGLQIVRCCGYYSNKARGQRRLKQCAAGITPVALSTLETEPDDFRRHSRRAWARLIRKVWAADPLACPKCGGGLRIIAFIDNPAVLEKILRHFKLWAPPERPPPPRRSTTLEPDADFLAWETTGRLFDGID